MQPTLQELAERIPRCTRCPELREYCAHIARKKRRAFKDWDYWGRPVPGFGDHKAPILLVGLAPAAHGGNRTGRIFTGDRSGDFLFAALHRAGLANQPTSDHRNDGLTLRRLYIAAALRCAPPGNRPTPRQLENCSSYLLAEFQALRPRVTLCLGGIAWDRTLATLGNLRVEIPRPKPKFGHGREQSLGVTTMLGCYHVSQQNTFTGRLTEAMIDDVLERAKELTGGAR